MSPRRPAACLRSAPRGAARLLAVLLLTALIAPTGGGVPRAAAEPAGEGGGQAPPDAVRVEVLSNRADLISGGDALVEVVLPAGSDASSARVDVDGRDVTGAFAVRPDGRFLGRLEDLDVGDRVVTAALPDGSGARITITNHPVGGPVFAGPQVQPWSCATVTGGLGEPLDEQCNAPTTYAFFYMPENRRGFQPYNPENPPADVAETTTDQGETVPYVVRRERGTMDRGIYDVAVLYDPEQPFEPWARQAGWNQKVLWLFGGGSAPFHGQTVPDDVLYDDALSRGFLVANSGLNDHGDNINDVVNAELVMMLKEHVVEAYGEIRYTIGEGCSGGGIAQYNITGRYPGLLDGLLPQCSYPDLWTTAVEVIDCRLLLRYFDEVSPQLWGAAQQRAEVSGHQTPAACEAWDDGFGFDEAFDPSQSNPITQCGVPAEQRYDAETNPDGVRCSVQDYEASIWGLRPEDGFAARPLDNVGVQYGLEAVDSGLITPEQFVDLNQKVGGVDIDLRPIPERMQADPGAVATAYLSGQVTNGRELRNVPIIDLRGTSNNEIHTDYHSYEIRERLVAANGHADNQAIWTGPVALVGDAEWSCGGLPEGGTSVCAPDSPLLVMDRWLAAIEADPTDEPLEVKVVRNKPAEAVDTCFIGGDRVTDEATCRGAFPYFGDPRIAAGEPLRHDVMKCRLQPLDRASYDVVFSDAQWERLQAAFPDGVCDWNQPGEDQQPPILWPTFAGGPGGAPLGDPPTSVPFAPADPAGEVERHAGATRIQTAVAVSGRERTAAETVVIARADDYPDALAGAPLAVHLDAPLLLSGNDGLSPDAAAEIGRLGADRAILLGGATALSEQVERDLTLGGVDVERVGGTDRFATAVAIAALLPISDEVFVARGDGFADALTASALAAESRQPVLLSGADELPAATAAALDARVVDATIIGGTTAVSQAVADAIDRRAVEVERLAGETRYATSVAVAEAALARGITPGVTWVATGTDFPDALVAGAAAGRDGGLLMLVDGADLDTSAPTRDFIAAHAGDIDTLRIAGGPAAVSAAVESDLAALLDAAR